MAERKTIQYFKRDKWLGGNEVHQVIEFTIINGRRIELLMSTDNSCLMRDYYPCHDEVNAVLKEELDWLAANRRGIFRLIAMYLNPQTSVYQEIAKLAAEHEIIL